MKNKRTHMRGENEVVGHETDTKICTECKQALPVTEFFLMRKNKAGIYYTIGRCKTCQRKTLEEARQLKIDYAEVKPNHCMLCEVETDKLEVDHCHDTGAMRGWICKKCNTGLGKFNDDTQLLIKAIEYLHKDPIKKPPKKQLELFDEVE